MCPRRSPCSRCCKCSPCARCSLEVHQRRQGTSDTRRMWHRRCWSIYRSRNPCRCRSQCRSCTFPPRTPCRCPRPARYGRSCIGSQTMCCSPRGDAEFAGHVSHTEPPAEYLPASHGTHVERDVAALADEYVPAPQLVHSPSPCLSLYVPGLQLAHVPPTCVKPALHVHDACPD